MSRTYIHMYKGTNFLDSEKLLTIIYMDHIIELANQTRSDFPFVPASEQIHRYAIEQPEKTAVIVSGRKISYAELDKKSNCVANVLLSRHLDKDTLVGVLL